MVSNRLKMLLETVNTDIQFLEVKIKEKIMKRTLINIMVDPQKIVTKEKIRNED